MRLAASFVAAAAAMLGGASADPGRTPTSSEDSAVVAVALPQVRDRAEALDRSSDRTVVDVDAAAIDRVTALSTQAAEISKASDDAKIAAKAAADAKAAAAAKTAAAAKAAGASKPVVVDPGSARDIARQMMLAMYGWGDDQFTCFDKIITQESGWNVSATNKSSGAYGIPQALPGSKMASAGADWQTNPTTQIKWALGYVQGRYGTPCQAWTFKLAHGWY
jgi:hypothetical protein